MVCLLHIEWTQTQCTDSCYTHHRLIECRLLCLGSLMAAQTYTLGSQTLKVGFFYPYCNGTCYNFPSQFTQWKVNITDIKMSLGLKLEHLILTVRVFVLKEWCSTTLSQGSGRTSEAGRCVSVFPLSNQTCLTFSTSGTNTSTSSQTPRCGTQHTKGAPSY